jgi:glycosyltransferase involved in cell wall biosynthesis
MKMERPAPLVSIVVPAFNAANYLPALCRSIQAQTFDRFEVLIGDDGSTDHTAAAMAPFVKDARFRYFRWEPNRGVNQGTVLLLSQASGQFWVYPGADDALEPEFLERRLEFMQSHSQVGMVHGPPTFIDDAGTVIPAEKEPFPVVQLGELTHSIIPSAEALEILLQHNVVNTPSVMVRMAVTRSIFSCLLTEWRYAQDWSFWILHAAAGWDMGFDSRRLNHYRILASSLSNAPDKSAVRRAETRLVPLCALGRAATFSAAAARLWSRWRRALYALWLRRALALVHDRTLNDAWLQAGAAAFYRSVGGRVSLAREVLRHAGPVLLHGINESRACRQQSFRVSGLAQINNPCFRRR